MESTGAFPSGMHGKMLNQDDVLDLIGELYRAAGEESHWPVALRRLSAMFDNSGIFILTLEHASGDVPHALSHDLPAEGVRQYTERFALMDPLARYALANPKAAYMDDVSCVDQAGEEHGEFYTWLQHSMGYRYRLKAKLFETDGRSTYAVLKRTGEQGVWSERHAASFLSIVPHLSQAVRLSQNQANLRAQQAAMGDAADRLPYGILLLDARRRIVRANWLADDILRQADGLLSEQGRLRAVLPVFDKTIDAVLHGTVSARPEMAGEDCRILDVPRVSGKRPYSLLISPFCQSSTLLATDRPVAMLFITDPERNHQPPVDRLCQCHGLTPKEAQLASLLLTGETLEQAAEAMGITRGTARAHLERVFKKTGVRRQVELVRLLMSSAASIK